MEAMRNEKVLACPAICGHAFDMQFDICGCVFDTLILVVT